MDLRHRVCVRGKKRAASLQALHSKSQAAHAESGSRGFKQTPVIWMRRELPAEQSEDPHSA